MNCCEKQLKFNTVSETTPRLQFFISRDKAALSHPSSSDFPALSEHRPRWAPCEAPAAAQSRDGTSAATGFRDGHAESAQAFPAEAGSSSHRGAAPGQRDRGTDGPSPAARSRPPAPPGALALPGLAGPQPRGAPGPSGTAFYP